MLSRMKNEQTAKQMKKWVDKVGVRHALVRLIGQGVSPRTAQLLVAGSYKNSPSSLLAKVLTEELAKDGIALAS
jgi:hypothetical protein